MPGGLIEKQTEPSVIVNQFSELYCDLIANLYDVKCAKFLSDVKKALKDIRRLKYDKNQRHERNFYIDIKYEDPAVRCAYQYAYSVLNTSIVYSQFSKHLESKKGVLHNLFSKKKLKICCLGGGPATEAVAISKAISDFISKSSGEACLFSDVEVIVVDIIPEWKAEGEALINALNNSSNLFISERIRFHYHFLKADLLSSFGNILEEKITEADIVTVVKFGSSIEEKSASVCVTYLENMIKTVIDCMDVKSCLFMLDVAGSKIFRHTMDVVSKQTNTYSLDMSLHKKYRLLPKTLKKMETSINFRNFGETATLFPTVFTTISSCFWIKNKLKSQKKESKDGKSKTHKKNISRT